MAKNNQLVANRIKVNRVTAQFNRNDKGTRATIQVKWDDTGFRESCDGASKDLVERLIEGTITLAKKYVRKDTHDTEKSIRILKETDDSYVFGATTPYSRILEKRYPYLRPAAMTIWEAAQKQKPKYRCKADGTWERA